MVERVPDKNEVHGSIPCAPTMPQLKEVLGEQMVQQLKRLAIQVDANKWQPSIFQGPVWFELLAKHNGNEGSARQELAEIFSKEEGYSRWLAGEIDLTWQDPNLE